MSIKKHGGIFGRNPTFNDVDVEGTLTVDGSFVVNGASMAPIFRGTWDADTNTPTLASGVGTQGDFYIVSVGGNTNLDGASTWGVGDWVLFNGSAWQRVEGGVDGDFGNILVSGNTISITNLDGDLNLQPDGTGTVNIPNVDIDGGSIDGTIIGGTTASTGVFTQVNVDNVQVDGNEIITTNTNGTLEINPDGTGGVGIGGDTVGVVAGATVSSKFCAKNELVRPTAGFVHAENTTATSGSWVYACRSRGTLAAPTAVQNNDNLATWFVAGHDGTDLAIASQITFDVDGTPGNNDMPGRIVVSTTPDGTQTPVEAVRINNAQITTFAKNPVLTDGTASTALALDSNKAVVSVTNTGTGNNVLATDPTIGGATITGGTINNTPIGGTTASTGAFTTASASTSVTTPLITRAGNIELSATGANLLDFKTNGQDRMRITSAGNVGIGTTAPVAPLHVVGGARISGNANITNLNGSQAVTVREDQQAVVTYSIGSRDSGMMVVTYASTTGTPWENNNRTVYTSFYFGTHSNAGFVTLDAGRTSSSFCGNLVITTSGIDLIITKQAGTGGNLGRLSVAVMTANAISPPTVVVT